MSIHHPKLTVSKSKGSGQFAENSNYPNLVQSSILIISQILLYFMILYIIVGFGALKYKGFSLLANDTIRQVSYILSSLVVIIYGMKKSGHRLNGLFQTQTKKNLIYLIFIIPILLIGYSIMISELNNVLRHYIKIPDSNIENALYSKSITGFLLGCVFAPATEEFIYRGIILNGYSKNYNTTIAIILSSLLYGLAQIDPGKILMSFIFGLFLSWLSIKTASLFYSVWAHIAINTINFAVQFNFIPFIRGFSPANENASLQIQHQSIWFTFTGVVISVLSTWYILKIGYSQNTHLE